MLKHVFVYTRTRDQYVVHHSKHTLARDPFATLCSDSGIMDHCGLVKLYRVVVSVAVEGHVVFMKILVA
jgi:hypothetical protein